MIMETPEKSCNYLLTYNDFLTNNRYMKQFALKIPGGNIQAPKQVENLTSAAGEFGGNLFGVAINILFITASIIALIFIVLGGIRWITSEGDPKNIAAARSQIIYAVIGLCVVFLAYGIVNIVMGIFGVKLL